MTTESQEFTPDHPDPGLGLHSAADDPTRAEGSSRDEPTRVSDGSSRAARQDSIADIQIAGYQLRQELHRGGQGVVYRAIQLGTKRQVALKVLLEGPFASDSARRRFEREVELAASLRHTNIVTILDSGISHGRYYFAMEYIDGLRLDRYLAKLRPSMRDTLRLFEGICAAVNFAHQRGVIHRDLKPPNILVDDQGEPHILDFGLAKPVHHEGSDQTMLQTLSTAGQLLGTVAYMSPEQTRGSQDVDVRSDVYSLGVVFYEALLGQLPYSVDGPLGEVLNRIATADPERPRVVRTHSRFGRLVNDELDTILLKTLEKDPARRYQTVGDLGRDLRHLLAGEPIEAKRASGFYMFRKTLRRYRLQAAAAVGVLLTLVIFLVAFAFLWSSERDSRERALRHQNVAVTRAIEARKAAEAEVQARRELEAVLVRQTIQRGELAQVRGDLIGARNAFWEAYQKSGNPTALWALRQYYLRSGDDGASPLNMPPAGITVLSADGRLVATGGAANSVSVCQVPGGRMVSWLQAPGTISVLHVDDGGGVCAAGPGWARLWAARESGPAISVELAEDFHVQAALPVSGGERLLLLGNEQVACFAGAEGFPTGLAELAEPPAGPPDYSERLRKLAVPSAMGVELFTINELGQIHPEFAGAADVRTRAVRFSGDELLAVSPRAITATSLGPETQHIWQEWINTPRDWELFDLHRTSGTVVFSTSNGHVTLFHHGKLEQLWRITPGQIRDLRLTEDGAAVVTVDDRGTVTRWIPPARRQNIRRIHPQAPAAWASSEDGASILLADEQQRVMIYTPQRSPEPRTLVRRRPFRLLPGPSETILAVSRQGLHTVVCTGNAVRLREIGTQQLPLRAAFSWDDPRASSLKKVSITGDGHYVAFCAETPAGDMQQVSFHRWAIEDARAGADLKTALPLTGQPLEFVGSVIRQIGFIPGTSQLLIARSNGEILRADPDVAKAVPWRRLDSPPEIMTFDRSGQLLAVACSDGFVRVFPLSNDGAPSRIRVSQPVATLAFNPRGDVLLVCTTDGAVALYEVGTAERVAQLRVPGPGQQAFATWIGNSDTLLLASDGAVYEHPYDDTDDIIARNRTYARRQTVARYLEDGEFELAWSAAGELSAIDPTLALLERETVLASALRRRIDIPTEWSDAVTTNSDLPALLRLGHAAYDGEHFELAGVWLRAAAEQCHGDLDAYSALRIAQCDYLRGAYQQAADELARVLTRPDLDTAHVPTVQLQQTAALVLAGDYRAAEAVARRIGSLRLESPRLDNVAGNSARDIARYLTGLESESLLAASVELFVTRFAAEGSLGFQDDAHFFQGEQALRRDEPEQAAAHYQRCIDTARDTWPANWSRFRLLQLSNRAP
ncbi:MAG: WD40 repeat domain-containing serine/threonine protein kinase [Planctomycetota bacterium]